MLLDKKLLFPDMSVEYKTVLRGPDHTYILPGQ